MAAAKVYVEQLYTRGHGWPPWEPESEVYPGDVGFFHDSGKLCRLFNVLAEKDDPINGGHRGTPDDFVPLRLQQYNWLINSDFFTPGRPIMTRKVTASAIDFQVVSDPIPAGVGVTYTCSRNLGAMLLPRSRTARVDIGDCKLVRDYIKNNIDSWYGFARQFFGEEQLPEGSLVLVRGCDKTESWVSAAFTERSIDAGLMFNGGLEPSGPGFKLKGSWKQTSYSFPETRDSEARAAPLTLSIEPTPTVLAAMFPPECRETVFVRVFKCWRRVRRLKIPKVIKAAAGPHDLPDSDGDPGSLVVASGDYDFVMSMESDLAGDIDPQQPDFSKHPIDPLLEYILRVSPDSQYAIATDADLYRIMSTGMDWTNIPGAVQASNASVYDDSLNIPHNRDILVRDMGTRADSPNNGHPFHDTDLELDLGNDGRENMDGRRSSVIQRPSLTMAPTTTMSHLELVQQPPVFVCHFLNCNAVLELNKETLLAHLVQVHGYEFQKGTQVNCLWHGCWCSPRAFRPGRCLDMPHCAHVEDLFGHIWERHLHFRWVCPQCDRADWVDERSRDRHRHNCKGRPTGQNPVRCGLCYQAFGTELMLLAHISNCNGTPNVV